MLSRAGTGRWSRRRAERRGGGTARPSAVAKAPSSLWLRNGLNRITRRACGECGTRNRCVAGEPLGINDPISLALVGEMSDTRTQILIPLRNSFVVVATTTAVSGKSPPPSASKPRPYITISRQNKISPLPWRCVTRKIFSQSLGSRCQPEPRLEMKSRVTARFFARRSSLVAGLVYVAFYQMRPRFSLSW